MGTREGISIWIVDGYLVRKNIYPDFGFSGNDLSCHFIPQKEIWIDGQVTCEETEYSIANELMERKLSTPEIFIVYLNLNQILKSLILGERLVKYLIHLK